MPRSVPRERAGQLRASLGQNQADFSGLQRTKGGGGGIRTRGPGLPDSSFQDWRIRPLCHPSGNGDSILAARHRAGTAVGEANSAAPGCSPAGRDPHPKLYTAPISLERWPSG
jgi:hypothetical protein